MWPVAVTLASLRPSAPFHDLTVAGNPSEIVIKTNLGVLKYDLRNQYFAQDGEREKTSMYIIFKPER